MKSRIFDGLDGPNKWIRPNFGVYLVWLFLWFVARWPCLAADWPMYRHDAQRSAATAEQLALPLKLAWSYTCAQPPAPAWPDTFPLDLLNRMDFDYAPQLAIAEGIVFFGSSADDTVRALDVQTGREKWHFITGGPVRFAPQIVSNRVYFASDDGYVYCLNADTGKGIWKFRLAPSDERFIGNHRIISRWPIRTGVLVADGVVYAVAGMWPAEGVFIYALNADTGKVLWCNDTVDGTPQGALLLGGDVLLVPNGNAKTTPLNRRTGKLMQWPSPHGRPGWVAGTYFKQQYLGGSTGRGGTWVTIDGDKEYSFTIHRPGELAIEPYSLTNGLLASRYAWGAGAVPQLSIEPSLRPFQTHERGKVSAIVHQGKPYARKAYGLALAGNALLLGHDGAVSAQNATNEIWRTEVKGEARELAVADGRLFVSTSEGVIYCFAPGFAQGAAPGKPGVSDQKTEAGGQTSAVINHQPLVARGEPSTINHLRSAGMDRGFALVLGDADGQMSMALAAQTQLRVINALTNEAAAKALREKLLAATAWYGSRIHVQHVERLDRLPFAQYFANAVIVAADEAGRDPDSKRSGRPSREGRWPVPTGLTSTNGIVTGGPRSVVAGMGGPGLSGKELYRVLRPCGGILLFPGLEKADADALMRACDDAVSHAQSVQVTTEPTPPSRHPSKEGTAKFGRDEARPTTPSGHPSKEMSATNDPLQGRGGPDALSARSGSAYGGRDRDRGGFPFFVRGKLPDSLDWDQEPRIKDSRERRGSDLRVKWPLRLLWFGGPSTRQVQNNIQGNSGSVPANGRFFMLSERALTAVDAYNGAVLWSRPIPKAFPGLREVDGVLYRASDSASGRPDRARSLLVNNESVFLVLGQEFSQGKGERPVTIQLDARTGEQQKIYGPFNPPTPPVVSLKTAQTWPLEANSNQSGIVVMDVSPVGTGQRPSRESTARGLVLTLTTQDSSVTPLDVSPVGTGQRPSRDAWELYFDFRPVEMRYGLYDRGAFHIRIVPAQDEKTPATWSLITGPDAPKINVSGTRKTAGTKTTVILPWPELEKWVGVKPASFDFAATLNAHDGGRESPIVRRHLFGNWAADGINNGWARIILNDAAVAPAGTNPPAIMGSGAPGGSHGPAGWGQTADPLVLNAPGSHPLTGEPVPKIYGIAPVCGGIYSSANTISQAGRLYDLAENGGAHRFYSGVKTGCTTPQKAALGLFLISEEWGHCVCNYPFRGSLALAPAEQRLNEDWTWFYERDVDTRVRQACINLGIGVDRRDEKGNLWLGFPRNNELQRPEEFPNPDHGLPYPQGMRDDKVGLWRGRAIRGIIWVPLDVDVSPVGTGQRPSRETMTNFGPYRFNTDRVTIKGTDRPWIYGSGYRGIQKATLKLDFFKPLVSTLTPTAPVVDGKLDEALWGDELRAAPALPYTGTRVVFRHDNQNLYVGMQRPPMTVVGRLPRVGASSGFTNEPRPWRTTTNSIPDKISSGDNQWRLIVSGNDGKQAAHFTMTPTGARSDALLIETRTNLDFTWNPAWQSAGQTNEQGWTLEMAIPWTTLAEAGLNKDQLAVNFLMFDPGQGTEALTYLGIGGAEQCSNFTPLGFGKPAAVPTRAFTVRLHFAEPDDITVGQRIFDVKLQGQTVLKNFDIVKEAKAPLTALVKEFKSVKAAEALTLEFVPAAKVVQPETAPILCGLELAEEASTTAGKPSMQ